MEDYENYDYSQDELQELSLALEGKVEKTFVLNKKTLADIEASARYYGISEDAVLEILIAQGKKSGGDRA